MVKRTLATLSLLALLLAGAATPSEGQLLVPGSQLRVETRLLRTSGTLLALSDSSLLLLRQQQGDTLLIPLELVSDIRLARRGLWFEVPLRPRPGPAPAGQPPSKAPAPVYLAPGARLRVLTPRARVAGSLLALTDTALVLARDTRGDSVVIPLDIVSEVRVAEAGAWLRVPVLPGEAPGDTVTVREHQDSAATEAEIGTGNTLGVHVGDRILYDVPGEMGASRVGRVRGVQKDALILLPDAAGNAERVPTRYLRNVRVSRGWERGTNRAAAIGCALGTLAGAYWGNAGYSDDDILFDRGSSTVLGAMIFGTLGAGLGAIVGSFSHREIWVPARPTIAAGITRDSRMALSVRLLR